MNHSGIASHVMPFHRLRHAMLVAANVLAVCTIPPSAEAATDMSINGRYTAISLGNWAKTNGSYHDEATVKSVWTISSSCSDPQDCTGTVTSDQGWSAPLYMHDGQMWYVVHDVPNWEKCADGSAATGSQAFTFYPADSVGNIQVGSSTLAGKDKTTGPSGACRVNKWLVIEMPFRLDRIS